MIASPSSIPKVDRTLSRRSEPKILIRSSSKLRKKQVLPGSPCLPERPLNWLSILRLSCRSDASTNRPPASITCSFSLKCFSEIVLRIRSGFDFGFFSRASRISISILPPNCISVPRPAMFVAIVTAPNFPALATILASCSCCRAFKTLCFTPDFLSKFDNSSDFSIDVVPNRIGWPFELASLTSPTMASYFSSVVL